MSLGRSQAKLIMRLALMGFVGLAGIIAVSFLSRAMTDITRSEETAAVFNVSAELDHDLIEAVEWLPDVPNLPKELAPLDREALTETWLRAWTQFLILSDGSGPVGSSVDGDVTDGITEYFDGSAADAMLVGAEDWRGLPVHQIGHDLRLTFYSDDGAVVSVTSESSRFLRGQPVGDTIEWFDTTESYDAVFVLQDGNWRIHHWVRRSAEGAWANQLDGIEVVPLAIQDMRAVTWRPATQTLEEFWTDPELATAEAEFAILEPLGFNTVRIELPFEELGGRRVNEARLFAAAALLDIAEENGLNVVFSLLHGRTAHQPLHWDADDDHLDDVVALLGRHPALVLWELAAEPDLHVGIERVDDKMLTAWLTHVARTVRIADDDTPLTIGWSSARAAAEAPPIADVVSFAWSGDTAAATADLDYVRTAAGGRPILIADATHHTHLGPLPGGQTEAEQARFFADMLIAVDELGLSGFSVSTLRDFDVDAVAARAQATAERLDAEEKARIAEQERLYPPPVTPEPQEAGPEVHSAPIVAEVTWPTGGEAAAGLIRVDGTAKPAAAVFALDADLDGVPGPSLLDTIRKPFNLVLVVLAAIALGGWLLLALWAQNTLPFPQMLRRQADGNDAQRRRWRDRKKTSVTAPIEDKLAAQAVKIAPDTAAPAAVHAPKEGRLRRVVSWLNAPVLPEGDPAPVVTAVPGVAVMPEAPAVAAQPAAAQPVAPAQPVTPAQPDPAAPPSLDELSAAQQAQFQAWLATQNQTVAPSVAAVPVAEARSDAQPIASPAQPAETLADALPIWPTQNMVYDEVHDALFSEDVNAPAATAMSIAEVDLQAIDAVIEQDDRANTGPSAERYGPFLMRALCMAAREFSGEDQPVHISVNGVGFDDLRIANAHDKRLSALTRDLARTTANLSGLTPTVAVNLSNAIDGHLSVEIGDGQTPTISLVYMSKRPIATHDRLGSTAITTHSMGLLSVAAATTPGRADHYLKRVREVLETRDWATELD